MKTAETTLESVADDFLARYRAGERPSSDVYAEKYPELADEIVELLESVKLMEQLSESESAIRALASKTAIQPPHGLERLGDFEILREIGRGGMGIVYEATDRSLDRRVALKVLHASALASQKHVGRFRRESQLAAQLHHTNIVSVFGVGEENGTHFYAMQFVDGVTVENILDGLRCLSEDDQFRDATGTDCRLKDMNVAAALKSGEFAQERKAPSDVKRYASPESSTLTRGLCPNATVDYGNEAADVDAEAPDAHDDDTRTQPCPANFNETSEVSDKPNVDAKSQQLGMPYWRSVVRIGVQVADALQYAHASGILHRDIKPANLLFDAHGTVWVTDFGLAKLADHDDLTKTGVVVGTLRYMAPEQLAGKADVRTDIYALGLTLYEMLTLKPACDGESYQQVLAQKQQQSCVAARKINSAVPRDLETIVHKMLAIEPAKRYALASEVSDDLQRFLDDRPIRARRVTPVEHFWRWCRRNRGVAALAAVSMGLLLLLPMILGWAYVRETAQRRQTERTLGVALEGFDELYRSFLDEGQLSITDLGEQGMKQDFENLAPATLTRDVAGVLERMLVFYDRLAQENQASDDEELRNEAAKARRRVGDLYQRLGHFSEANDAYRDAITRYARLAKNDPTRHAIEVSRIHNSLADMHTQRQEHQRAKDTHRLALETLQGTPSDDVAEWRFEIARTYYLLGKSRGHEGPPNPKRLDHVPHRAAPMWDNKARHDHIDIAINHLEQLLRSDPQSADYRYLLALCLREQSARTVFHDNTASPRSRAASLLRELANEFPDNLRYRFELSETYRTVKHDQLAPEDVERAIEQLLTAQEISEQLVSEQGQVASYRIQLAHIYAYLGIIYGSQRAMNQAERYSRMALESHRLVVRKYPGLMSLSEQLSWGTRQRIAAWLLQQFRWEEVIELLRPPAESLRSEIDAEGLTEPMRQVLEQELAESIRLLSHAYDCLGDSDELNEVLQWMPALGPSLEPNIHGPEPPREPLFFPIVRAIDTDRDGTISAQELTNAPAALCSLDQNKDGILSLVEALGDIDGPQQGHSPPISDHAGPPPPLAGPPHGPPHLPSAAEFVDTLLTYDRNSDGRLTREELPSRMQKEWFERADSDSDNTVIEEELSDVFERHSTTTGPRSN